MAWSCDYCGGKVGRNDILFASYVLCSDICHLKLWKKQLPSLGGRWITDEDLAKVESLRGEARKAEYKRIEKFLVENLDSTEVMLTMRYAGAPENDR